jgi:hypothetical protein
LYPVDQYGIFGATFEIEARFGNDQHSRVSRYRLPAYRNSIRAAILARRGKLREYVTYYAR